MSNIIQLSKINKKFGTHQLLSDFSIVIEKGKMTAIVGKSGSGKTTLLNIIGFLEPFESGDYFLEGHKNIKPYSRQARKFYKNKIGFLFQGFALIEHESVIYNLSLVLSGISRKVKVEMIEKVLNDLNILHLLNSSVSSCSGGEKQRIALARLMLQNVDIILADEPTGSLDNETKWEVFGLLKQLQQTGKTIIIVTHDEQLKDACDKIIDLNK